MEHGPESEDLDAPLVIAYITRFVSRLADSRTPSLSLLWIFEDELARRHSDSQLCEFFFPARNRRRPNLVHIL
jgi:hypothetical protein